MRCMASVVRVSLDARGGPPAANRLPLPGADGNIPRIVGQSVSKRGNCMQGVYGAFNTMFSKSIKLREVGFNARARGRKGLWVVGARGDKALFRGVRIVRGVL